MKLLMWLTIMKKKTEWTNYLKTTLGINPQDGSELPTGIVAQYKSSKDFVDKRFESFETNYYNSVFCATCSYDINKDKERKMNFSQVLFPNQIEVDNMKAINSSVNSTGDEYNLKVSFN